MTGGEPASHGITNHSETRKEKATSKSNVVHYVRFWYPGVFVSEDSTKRIASRNPALVKPPKDCYAFQFFDRTETSEDGETLRGKERNKSGMFFVGGRVMTLTEVRKELKGESTLIANMENNGYKRVIRTVANQFIPFGPKDKLLEAVA